jgi:hypothetical protein
MSEFQYCEFVAVDRPLTPDEMRALRAITSRATITPTRLVNTYEWGDFKGDPRRPWRGTSTRFSDGLGMLSGSLLAFADFLRIDQKLIAVAAERSAELSAPPSSRVVRRWLSELSPEEKDSAIERLLTGEPLRVRKELRQQLAHRAGGKRATRASRQEPRSVGDLLRAAMLPRRRT